MLKSAWLSFLCYLQLRLQFRGCAQPTLTINKNSATWWGYTTERTACHVPKAVYFTSQRRASLCVGEDLRPIDHRALPKARI